MCLANMQHGDCLLSLILLAFQMIFRTSGELWQYPNSAPILTPNAKHQITFPSSLISRDRVLRARVCCYKRSFGHLPAEAFRSNIQPLRWDLKYCSCHRWRLEKDWDLQSIEIVTGTVIILTMLAWYQVMLADNFFLFVHVQSLMIKSASFRDRTTKNHLLLSL